MNLENMLFLVMLDNNKALCQLLLLSLACSCSFSIFSFLLPCAASYFTALTVCCTDGQGWGVTQCGLLLLFHYCRIRLRGYVASTGIMAKSWTCLHYWLPGNFLLYLSLCACLFFFLPPLFICVLLSSLVFSFCLHLVFDLLAHPHCQLSQLLLLIQRAKRRKFWFGQPLVLYACENHIYSVGCNYFQYSK